MIIIKAWVYTLFLYFQWVVIYLYKDYNSDTEAEKQDAVFKEKDKQQIYFAGMRKISNVYYKICWILCRICHLHEVDYQTKGLNNNFSMIDKKNLHKTFLGFKKYVNK